MPYLREAIQSVVNQTYKDWILYLINDGSTDDSLALMEEFAEKDMRIRIIDDGQNKGLIARLNQSTALCDTTYYARMDADDIMYIKRIEEQVNYLTTHPEVDVCGSSYMTIDNCNKIVGSAYEEGRVSGFLHPDIMGKTEWFKANPYADWALRAEDFELWTRTSGKSNFYRFGKPLLFYRELGVPTFKKYYFSEKMVIIVSSRYKQYGKPFLWFFKTASLACIKIIINALCAAVGRMDVLIALRRRNPIPDELKLDNNDLIECIKPNS